MRGALPSATLGPEVSEATEGVEKSLNSHPLTVEEQFSVLIRLCRLFLLVARHNKSNNFASALASCVGSPFRFHLSVFRLLYPMLVYLPIQRIACDA